MTSEDFLAASLGQLGVMTGLDRHRWSKYLSGKMAITDKTLSRIAPKLEMSPGELLTAILERREKS